MVTGMILKTPVGFSPEPFVEVGPSQGWQKGRIPVDILQIGAIGELEGPSKGQLEQNSIVTSNFGNRTGHLRLGLCGHERTVLVVSVAVVVGIYDLIQLAAVLSRVSSR